MAPGIGTGRGQGNQGPEEGGMAIVLIAAVVIRIRPFRQQKKKHKALAKKDEALTRSRLDPKPRPKARPKRP